jgi:hypothetical protein
MRRIMVTAYIYDEQLRNEANRNSKNYWYEYIKEINCQMGLYAEQASICSLEDPSILRKIGALFIGDLKQEIITETARRNLESWVKDGGLLIGFATEGLDDLFGNVYGSKIKQVPDEYRISGYFSLGDVPITSGIHSYLHPEQRLIIISDINSRFSLAF